MISIIVPVYNVEQRLNKCIDSIISQTYSDFELILVDDGSNDRSGEICDYYASIDDRVIVKHTVNSGVSHARNTGLDIASGDLITFVDSDDYVEVDFLKEIELLAESDIDCIFFSIQHENAKGEMINLTTYSDIVYDRKTLGKALHSMNINFVYSKAYKKEIIDQAGLRFDTRFSMGEDTIFVIKYLALVKKIKCSSRIMYHYITWSLSALSSRYYANIAQVYDCMYDNNFILTKIFPGYKITYSKQRLIATMSLSNLYAYDTPLSAKKRREELNKMLKNKELRSEFINCNDKSMAMIIYRILFLFKSPYLADLVLSIIKKVKYNKVRGIN